MSVTKVPIPTCGRIVHVHHINGQKPFAMIVHECGDDRECTGTIVGPGLDALCRSGIPHRLAETHDGGPWSWEWPPGTIEHGETKP